MNYAIVVRSFRDERPGKQNLLRTSWQRTRQIIPVCFDFVTLLQKN